MRSDSLFSARPRALCEVIFPSLVSSFLPPPLLLCLYLFLFLFTKVIHAGPKISHNQWGEKRTQRPHLFTSLYLWVTPAPTVLT